MKSKRSPPSMYSKTRSTSPRRVRALPTTQPETKSNLKKNKLTIIITSFVWWERLAEATNIWVIELLQNIDLSLEVLHRGSRAATAIACAGAGAAAVVFVVIVVIRRAELLRVDDLDGPPLARVARYRLHHRRERAAPELVRHVVLGVYAGQLLRREVPVDEPVVFVRLLLLHRRAERDLVPVAQDARFSFGDARVIDLRTWGMGVSECVCMRVFNAVWGWRDKRWGCGSK